MKAFLNILPPSKKEAIVKKRFYRSIVHQEVFILFLFVFIGAMLAGVWGSLRYQHIELQGAGEHLNGMQQKQKDALTLYEETFSKTETMLKDLDALFAKQQKWSWAFLLINNILPEGVVIQHLQVQEDMLILEGVASTRETLLSVERVFTEQECFSDATIPLSHLAQRENISFKMTVTIDAKCSYIQ